MPVQRCNYVLNIMCFCSMQNYELNTPIKNFFINAEDKQQSLFIFLFCADFVPCRVCSALSLLHWNDLHRFCCAEMSGTVSSSITFTCPNYRNL